MIRFSLVVVAAALFATASVPAQQPASILPRPGDLPAPQTAIVFGQRMVYYEAGEGPALVLVHGFGSQALFDWGRVIKPLAQNHHVIAVDQVGFGHSDKPFIDYRIQTFVDFLGEFLRVKNIQRFDLAGESLGGWIVATYSIEALLPSNKGEFALPVPNRLILEDAAGHALIPHTLSVTASLQDSAGVAIVFHDKSLVNQDFIRRNWELKMQANDGQTQRLLANNPALASELVTGKLGVINIPTLVVWGADDELIPLSDGRDYAAKIPNAKLAVVQNCGHAPSLEKPSEFIAAVEAFLR
jgi:2-hydroxy-6-oxonona-2,4-dienedioate hydrolase